MLRLITLNVNGIRENHKRRMCFEFCRESGADIIFLQEVHISCGKQIREWGQQFGGQCCWSLGSPHSRGVGILFHPKLKVKILFFKHDQEGRFILAHIEFESKTQRFCLANVYCPNEPAERRKFFMKLYPALQNTYNLILGGDFNFIENPRLDKFGGNLNFGCCGKKEFSPLKQDFLLWDAFRYKFPSKLETSWNNGLVFCRLDRFYVNKDLLPCVHDVQHSYCPFSDHKFVNLLLKISNQTTFGKSFWKCNVKVLGDSNLRKDLETFFQANNSTDADSLWWENTKEKIKNIIILHSKKRARESRAREIFLERQLLEYQRCTMFLPGAFKEEIDYLKAELHSLITSRLEGVMIRSRATFIKNIDSPSSFFIRKERQHRSRKQIKTLMVDGVLITEREQLISTCKLFYQQLLTAKDIDLNLLEYFMDGLPRLSDEQRELCEGPITQQEILSALKLMKNNKCPGSDGLPKEFYSEYFPLFIGNFTNMVNKCFTQNSLCPSQKLAIINLLCKNQDHPELLNNWRPISLLNVDYKIISKVLSLRLGRVLPSIISIDQTCAVKGRSIQDNVHLLRNVIDYCNGKNMGCCLINLDQSKAFDRISHHFLFKCLHAFGFGTSFIRWVRLLYTSSQSRVEVNGFLSDTFPVTCGVRQGCSLSPLLYVLCVETFARRIRCDPHIRGLRLPTVSEELRITQYADDSTLVLTDYNSPRKAFLVAELFGLASGAILNVDKCRGLWLGAWTGSSYKPLPIIWTSDVQKFCGIFLGSGGYEKENENLLMQTFCKTIDLLKRRGLNLVTKPMVINSLACSRLWYVLSVLPTNESLYKKLTSYMFRFIWKNSTERVRRSIIYQNYEYGGLRVVDIYRKICAYHIRHIFSFLKGDFAKWHSFTEYWLGLSLRHYKASLWRNDIPHSSEISPFYKGCLKIFRSVYPDPHLINGPIPSLKSIYWKLIEQEAITPNIFRKHREIDFKQSMKHIHNKLNYPDSRELSWQVALNVQATNDNLYKYHIVQAPNCTCCSDIETAVHLFLKCRIAQPVWQEISTFLHNFSNRKSPLKLDYRAVLFNIIPPPVRGRLKRLFLILLNVGKKIIWDIRNLIKFEHRHFSSIDISTMALSRIRFRVKTDQCLLSDKTFHSLWLRAPSGVRLKKDGNLFLCLPLDKK